MFWSSLIEELCTKEENDKTGCKLNFGHECNRVPDENKILLESEMSTEQNELLKQDF